MGQTPRCELHNGEHDAAYIIGQVETGAQLFLCNEGAAHFGLTLALQILDPAEIINTAQAIGTKPADNGEAPADKPARKRAAKKTSKPGARVEPEPGLPEAPAPADDR
jgi:hypothetical protein